MSAITLSEGIEAIDALNKIQKILAAATYLNSSDEETELQLELMNLAESIAAKTLECCK